MGTPTQVTLTITTDHAENVAEIKRLLLERGHDLCASLPDTYAPTTDDCPACRALHHLHDYPPIIGPRVEALRRNPFGERHWRV